jgi:hypothetical protein
MIDPDNYSTSFSFCHTIFDAALRSAQKVASKSEASVPADNALAIGSAALAAAAIEGFINEAGETCIATNLIGVDESKTKLFGELWQLSDSRASPQEKYRLANVCLRGRPYDAGRQPYQDFELLFKVRNALMHGRLSSRTVQAGRPVSIPPIESGLSAAGVLRGDENGWAVDWRFRILNREFAYWAVRTASRVINDVLDAFRADPGGSHLFKAWDNTFVVREPGRQQAKSEPGRGPKA